MFKFYVDFRIVAKNPEKIFCFLGNSIWIGWRKFSLLQREYVLSAVIMSTNSPKISDGS